MEKHYGPVLCDPCKGDLYLSVLPDHNRCEGVPWCECWTEVLIEAEENP